MPDLIAVKPLSKICLNCITCHLADINLTSSCEAAAVLEAAPLVQEYLSENVPPGYCDELVQAVLQRLSKYFYDPKWKHRRGALAASVGGFLCCGVQRVHFGECRLLCDRLSVPVVLQALPQMKRLRELVIGRLNVWKIPELSTLNHALSGLSQLSVLRLEYICVPGMLRGLHSKCPQLRELSMKDSAGICNAEVPQLVRCSGLRTLDVSGTSITGSGAWLIMTALEDLLRFVHCPFNCNSGPFLFDSREQMLSCIRGYLGSVSNRIAAREPGRHLEPPLLGHQPLDMDMVPANPDPPHNEVEQAEFNQRAGSQFRQFKMENFWLFNPNTEEVSLVELCPETRQLRLDFVFQDMAVIPGVSALGRLTSVTCLDLRSFDSPRLSVLAEVLHELGPRLRELSLHICAEFRVTSRLENIVVQTCPALERYSFSGDYLLPMQAAGDEAVVDGLDLDVRPRHPQLRHLSLSGVVTDRRLQLLLSDAQQLSSLQLDGDLLALTDAGWSQLLAGNSLRQLRRLWINVSAGCSLSAVSPLILDPTSRLERVGRLSSLSGSTRQEFICLRDRCRRLNYHLELVWVTPGV